IGNFNPQDLSSAAWAFATLGAPAPQLFEAIAHESELRIGRFKPKELANTVWAFATLDVPAPQLFDAIARESEQHIGNFKTQGLANTAWAFATLGAPAPQLFEAIARESEQRVGSFNPRDLVTTAQWQITSPRIHADGATPRQSAGAASGEGGDAPIELPDDDVAARAREAVRAAMAKYAGIVIEVDGPTHYDDERRLRPASEMIRRHLRLAGWAVLGVPYWEWNVLNGQARKAYLAKL
ncbi:hypothetical protein T492DRAFT_578349, partial [Pavlovales sp. CCMP2436]